MERLKSVNLHSVEMVEGDIHRSLHTPTPLFCQHHLFPAVFWHSLGASRFRRIEPGEAMPMLVGLPPPDPPSIQ